MDTLNTISPIDGRYRKNVEELASRVSEAALIQYRVLVEGEYLIALSDLGLDLRKFTTAEKKLVRDVINDFSPEDAQRVQEIEKTTDHDVKAVEYFLKEKLGKTSLKHCLEWIHFGLTSEDINSCAYGLMFSQAKDHNILTNLEDLLAVINKLAKEHAELPMLARTHGQPASPTTFGKEFKVFATRLERQMKQLKVHKFLVKLGGATGNFNAHVAAYPKTDWERFAKDFAAGLKLELNPYTTQIESHDTLAEFFDIMRRINTILIGFDQDMWRYISDGWLGQKAKEGEVGSSTMPHKINPIKFENSEGNLGIANALFTHFSQKLPISRLQRDLSDSTVERSIGTAIAYSIIGYKYTMNGLSRVAVNSDKVTQALLAHPEVLAEAIQTVLRREGVAMPYEQLKALTRGKEITMTDLTKFIDGLDVSASVKTELKKFTPQNYIGLASKLSSS